MNILFLHDTHLDLKRGAELTLTQLVSRGRQLGFHVSVDCLETFEQVKQEIQASDLVILSSTSRCQFEIDLLNFLLNSKIAFVKLEFDYNFCIRRNILCTVDSGIRNCCNTEKYHLFRTVFANAQLNIFQSPKHYQDHFLFYGEAVANHTVACPTVETEKLQISEEKTAEIPFFGDLNYLKGGHAFLDYAEEHPNDKFVVYGEHKLRREIPDNVTFKEPIENEEVLRILGKTKKIIIKPVWPEPSGRLAAEAFLSGCELITNDRVGTWSFDFYPNDKEKALQEIAGTIDNLWNKFETILKQKKPREIQPKLGKVLVRKSYGGLGDIFFTIPSIYKLKTVSDEVTYALHPRLIGFFQKYLEGVKVVSETEVDETAYDRVIELGNYPKFSEVSNHLKYITSKKVKQHAIQHYIDGVARLHRNISNKNEGFPYFSKQTNVTEPYYTVHPGAGFLLKAWPASYFSNLIKEIKKFYPELSAKLIKGPDDPDISVHLEGVKFSVVDGGIEDVGEAVSGALFHIGNDAGITHLAGAFNIPILTIYGPTGPGSWGAYSEHVELIWGKKGNCDLRCNYEVIINCQDRVCLNKVSHRQMFYRLVKLLSQMGYEPRDRYCFNPEFEMDQERESFIFKTTENEYLLEVKDLESLHFFENNLKDGILETEAIPQQFEEVLEGLLSLNVFAPIPFLKTNH
ncbi:MAG TPA: glycosyltransferase family 9 protein [Mangrovimonas sp.]|nr:glycosyltransferase family 9 protein [Mangrovimonas sp.]